MNLFDALEIFYKEDTISDFLVNCFNDSDEFIKLFLAKANINKQNVDKFTIKTRVGLGKNIGTPDMLIYNKQKVIVIENKMAASEGREQTNRYESTQAKNKIIKKFKLDADCQFHYIFLALDTTIKPKNSKFKFIDYQIFLEGDWLLHDPELNLLFKHFQEKLRSFYNPLKDPYHALQEVNLDSTQRKICWQNILFKRFEPYKDLKYSWGEVGGAGRSNFLFNITKEQWTSHDSFKQVGLSKTYNVHVDTYVNMLSSQNRVKEIGVRFETYPYVPHKKIKDDEEYARFLENKRTFSTKLYEMAKKEGISCRKRNRKLLVLSIPVDQDSIVKNVKSIEEQVIAIELCIDRVIEGMKEQELID